MRIAGGASFDLVDIVYVGGRGVGANSIPCECRDRGISINSFEKSFQLKESRKLKFKFPISDSSLLENELMRL